MFVVVGGTLCARAVAAAPAPLALGLADGQLFQTGSSASQATWLERAQALGSSWVRLGVTWSLVAPAHLGAGFQASNPGDPHYSWTNLDLAVKEAAGHHQAILLQLYGAPTWAEDGTPPPGSSPGAWRPDSHAFGQFARAVAERYSGKFPDPADPGAALPRVSHFEIWNEPNLRQYLLPQWGRTKSGAFVPLSPSIYRSLLNSAYAQIKAAQPGAYVVAGATAPFGDAAGVNRMRPALFLRELLCLSGSKLQPERCPDPAHFDALDHHPYGLTPTTPALNADDIAVPDLGKITRILSAAERAHRILPRGGKQLWVTEFGWSSSPPSSGQGAVPLFTQARYVSFALYEMWRQKVTHAFWLQVGDQPSAPNGLNGLGLYFADGAAKPAASAFRLPFVALRTQGSTVMLWGKAPASGVVEVEVTHAGMWRGLVRVRTGPDGVFYAIRRLGRHLTLRASDGPVNSPAWATG